MDIKQKIRAYGELIIDLERERDELDRSIDLIRRQIELLQPQNERTKSVSIAGGKYSGMTGVQAAKTVLAEKGKPLKIRKICEQINKNGGKVSPQSLYTSLMRAEKVERVGKGTFGLAEWRKTINAEIINEDKESAPLSQSN